MRQYFHSFKLDCIIPFYLCVISIQDSAQSVMPNVSHFFVPGWHRVKHTSVTWETKAGHLIVRSCWAGTFATRLCWSVWQIAWPLSEHLSPLEGEKSFHKSERNCSPGLSSRGLKSLKICIFLQNIIVLLNCLCPWNYFSFFVNQYIEHCLKSGGKKAK